MPGKAGRASAERNASGGAGAEAARKGRSLAPLPFFPALGRTAAVASGTEEESPHREGSHFAPAAFLFVEGGAGTAAQGGRAAVRHAEEREAWNVGKMKRPLRAAGAAKGRAGVFSGIRSSRTEKRAGRGEASTCERARGKEHRRLCGRKSERYGEKALL